MPLAIVPTVVVQLELSSGVWTDVTADVIGDVVAEYGIQGNGPRDRVASTGSMMFALNNATTNSAGLLGYYSPNHANVRSGFTLGIGVRLALTYSGTTYYKWRGSLDEIVPTAGQFRERLTKCTAVDWMDEAARYRIADIATQINKRSDQIFSTIVASMPRQPAAQNVGVGMDTYAYAVDTARDESSTALEEFSKLANSELGFIGARGDTTQGGTLFFEDRRKRAFTSTNAITLNDTMVELRAGRTRDSILNKVQTIVHQRRVDAAATTVLYSLQSQPSVGPHESITLLGPYRDPTQTAARVGGTEMVTPVATTDYTMNAAADGSGANMTSDFTVTASFGGNGVRWTVTNNSGTLGYITKLQCRGKGIYDFERVIFETEDSTSVTTYGENTLTMDMPYQTDPDIGRSASGYLMNLYKTPLTFVDEISFVANKSDALMTAALAREISDRIGIVETVTGLTTVIAATAATRGFFINGVRLAITPAKEMRCTWVVAPADATLYWILAQVGASELGITTNLGYDLFDEYWILNIVGRSELNTATRLAH